MTETLPDEIHMALLPDPHGGWGGPPYWQYVDPSTPDAVRFVPESALSAAREEAARAERERAARETPHDIRAAGWCVAVHNDYRLGGEPHTFWLFTKDGRAVKGEGRSDADALEQVRAAIRKGEDTSHE